MNVYDKLLYDAGLLNIQSHDTEMKYNTRYQIETDEGFVDFDGIGKINVPQTLLHITRVSGEHIDVSLDHIFVIDGDENRKEYDILSKLVDENKIIRVLNKSDKFKESELQIFKDKGYIVCSTLANSGLAELKSSLLHNIEISEEELHLGILTNSRQIAAVNKAAQSVSKALKSIRNGMGYEFTAFDLKEASTALEEIIGKVTSDDILNNIFANFCIGK